MTQAKPLPQSSPDRSPVFVHSLWRSGSTYIFNVFRRSPEAYWCYQEPVHEFPLATRQNPEALLSFTGGSELRHPKLDKPYFHELAEVASAWKDIIAKPIVYDEYFKDECSLDMQAYIAAILSAAKGRPVIQECRTSGRIGALKRAFGGVHIYLWRNPWDQWWSFKTNGYFDTVCQMLINAPSHPAAIAGLRQEIGFHEFHHQDIRRELDHFGARRLSSEDSYLAFYVLWLLALQEAHSRADCLMNIDMLSGSEKYRLAVSDLLATLGVTKLDFSDCRVFQNRFSPSEQEFFHRVEERAHDLLLRCGTSADTLKEILDLRGREMPEPATVAGGAEIAHAEAERARHVALRLATDHSRAQRLALSQIEEQRRELQSIRDEAAAEQEKSARLERRLEETWAEHRRALTAQSQQLLLAQQEVQRMRSSWTWRLAMPLRMMAEAFESLRCRNDILSLEGEAFVRRAYRKILGRDPDPEGLAHFLRFLKENVSKKEILRQLRRSPEAKLRNPLWRCVQRIAPHFISLQRRFARPKSGPSTAALSSFRQLSPRAKEAYFLLGAALRGEGSYVPEYREEEK